MYIKEYFEPRKVNDKIYIPSYTTWATHSICIKDTMYDALIDTYVKLDSPVDLLIMSLYDKFNFYVLYNDLFITSFDSDIRKCDEISEIKKWNWNMNDYFNINHLNIEKIIIWGFEKVAHTHHYGCLITILKITTNLYKIMRIHCFLFPQHMEIIAICLFVIIHFIFFTWITLVIT